MENSQESNLHPLHRAKRQIPVCTSYSDKCDWPESRSTSPKEVQVDSPPAADVIDEVTDDMDHLLDYAQGTLEVNKLAIGYIERICKTAEFTNCSIEGLENALFDMRHELKHALIDSDRSYKRSEKIMLDLRSILIELKINREYRPSDTLSLPNQAACYTL